MKIAIIQPNNELILAQSIQFVITHSEWARHIRINAKIKPAKTLRGINHSENKNQSSQEKQEIYLEKLAEEIIREIKLPNIKR